MSIYNKINIIIKKLLFVQREFSNYNSKQAIYKQNKTSHYNGQQLRLKPRILLFFSYFICCITLISNFILGRRYFSQYKKTCNNKPNSQTRSDEYSFKSSKIINMKIFPKNITWLFSSFYI